ncbi:AAA family ATPase [Streptomyces afghaniensis]|uniref:AAA family ATPase n=1 Tax=Streptomyces afghaniensis TaxID=66865 RepID=UPI00339EE436
MNYELGPGSVHAGRDIKAAVSTHVSGLPPDAAAATGAGSVTARDINAPVTVSIQYGSSERLTDALLDPAPLVDSLGLERFTGREWLVERVDRALARQDKGYVLVLSEAGIGKTSLAAHLAQARGWPRHFTALYGGRNPEIARKNLAAQLLRQWRLEDRLCRPGGLLPENADRPDWLLTVLHAAAARRDQEAPATPLVLVVDGLDEAEPSTSASDTGVPLGLPRPQHLPRGVHILTTSRFGTNLSALRGRTDVLEIQVDGAENRRDLLAYLTLRAGETGTPLHEAVRAQGTPPALFAAELAERCAGVWIYAQYVLDEIAQGTRSPHEVRRLPDGLVGYYEEQIARWQDGPDWDGVGEPLLALLAAAQGPAAPDVLAEVADTDARATGRWLDTVFRPFLRGEDGRYAIRHQSLRDLFATEPDDQLDAGVRRPLRAALRTAHRRIADWLVPVDGDWSHLGEYGRFSLPQHAAAADRLDELVVVPGFLLAVDPPSLLRHRSDLATTTGRRALGAYELALHDWREEPATERRLWWLHVQARKNRCGELAEACADGQSWPWRLRAAWWFGVPHRVLTTSVPRGVCTVRVGGGPPLLAVGRFDGAVMLWDPVSGDLLTVLSCPQGDREDRPEGDQDVPSLLPFRWVNDVCTVRVGDGRTLLAAGREDGSVVIWDPLTGQPIRALSTGHDNAAEDGRDAAVEQVCAVPDTDGRDLLVTVNHSGSVRWWDPDTGQQVGTLPAALHSRWVKTYVVPGPGGSPVLATADGSRLRLWKPGRDRPVGEMAIDGWSVLCAVPVGHGRTLLAAADYDGPITLWDPATGERVGPELTGQTGSVRALCAVPGPAGRSLLAAGSRDGTIRLWDTATGEPWGPALTGHTDEVASLCAVPSDDGGVRLASVAQGGDDSSLRLWDLPHDDPTDPAPEGHTGPVRALCPVPDVEGRTLVASAGQDASIRLWDPATGDLVQAWVDIPRAYHVPHEDLPRHNWTLAVCAITGTDGRPVVVSAHEDYHVRRWDPVTGEQIGSAVVADWRSVSRMCVVPGVAGRTLLAMSESGRWVLLWDPETREPLGEPLAGDGGTGYDEVCAVPGVEGRTLVAAITGTMSVRLYDPDRRCRVGKAMRPGSDLGHSPVHALCALPGVEGRTLLATGCDDGLVWLWDPVTCEPVGDPLRAHRGWVTAMCALPGPDGVRLVTVGGDGLLRLWDPITREPLGEPLSGHGDTRVGAVCTVPDVDGRTLIATGGNDRTVLLWEPLDVT